MMMLPVNPGEAPVSLDEARAWLRLGTSSDDAVVAALIRAATNICEAFIGQWLMIRRVDEEMSVQAAAMRLRKRPVVLVDSVTILARDGTDTILTPAEYAVTLARDGMATVRLLSAGNAERVRIGYRAGLAETVNDIPEALRQGIIRMVAHLHMARDGTAGEPPAIITAMWQPWRRMALAL